VPNGSRIQTLSGSRALIRPLSRFERLSISVNFERAIRRRAFSLGSTWVRVLTSCGLIFSVAIAGCTPALLQRQVEPTQENKANPKSVLLKPKISEVHADADAGTRNQKNKISDNDKSSSQRASENPSSVNGKQNPSDKSEKPKPDETKSNPDSWPEKNETSDPAKRIAVKGEDSVGSSEAGDSGEPKLTELFKRHNHAKYMEIVKNKAIDLVNSKKDCDQAIMCKDMITDQWSLTVYYVKEKAYKFTTYVWDEIDDNWQKSFMSDKLPLSGLQKHLKYSSSGKDCKPLKKARR
jgi:hypothetical protein